MLREFVIEEEMPGDFQTTFRLRVDGNVIAENMTELETQFLVSEMLERIPSLRVAASDDAEQPLEGVVKVTGFTDVLDDTPARNRRLRSKCAPLRQCNRASLLVNLPGDEMPLLIEMILDLGVN
jgi:hypothetical protein